MGERLERDLGMAFAVVVGLVFMAGGIFGEYVALNQRPIEKWLVVTFIIVTVFGALLLPSIFALAFPRVKQIFVLIFPNGLPLIGGRRASDPPASVQPPPPSNEPPVIPFPPKNGGA